MNSLQVVDLRNLDTAEAMWDYFVRSALDFTVPPSQLPRKLVSGSFPPADIYIDAEENLYVDMALAGFDGSKLSVKFDEEDHLLVSYKKDDSTESNDITYLSRGIKRESDFEKRFFVDKRYFDIDPKIITVDFKNGMLSIKIPRKKPNPDKELKINLQ